jgi:hypothetical protein
VSSAPCTACAGTRTTAAPLARPGAPKLATSNPGCDACRQDDVAARPSGRGRAIDPGVRRPLEARFGQDFSHVRVHADSASAHTAQRLGARAYTLGSDIAFAAGQYRPQQPAGLRLLAHELAHVVQQRGQTAVAHPRIDAPGSALEREADHAAAQVASGAMPQIHGRARGLLQRDLATPPPAEPVREQAELTDEQVQAAIRFNSARYNAANTRLIQNLLGGGEPTGSFTEDNIRAIAETQREYGLTADGKVGEATFRFLNDEQRLEGMSTSNANCLTAFSVSNFGATPIVRDAASGTCTLSGHFRTASQFSARCNCAQFQYRQQIRGHVLQNRGGAQVADLGATQFGRLPAGALTANFEEDGDRLDPVAVNYGHRDNAASANPEDHYIDDSGADDQAAGCRYRSEDFTGFGNLPGIPDCRVGDVIDADMTYRGDIERNGALVQSKQWSAIRGRFTVR